MDFMNQYDSPMMETQIDMGPYVSQMYSENLDPSSIHPFLTMKDWSGQEEVHGYVNPAMI
jgi:hypothetical protein